MKKLLALLLAIIMLLSLCACDGSVEEEEDDEKPTKATVSEEKEEEETKDSNEEEEDEKIKETEPELTETEPEPTETEPQEKPVKDDETDINVFGTIKKNKYENPYIGIGIKLNDNWHCYSDEELSELNGFVVDRLGGNYQEVLENGVVFYDLFVQRLDCNDNININMEKVSASQLKNFDSKKNLEKLLPSMYEVYESMGCSDAKCEVDTVIIDGEEFACMVTEVDISGITLYQIMLQIPCKEHLAAVTISALDTSDLLDYLDLIYLLN